MIENNQDILVTGSIVHIARIDESSGVPVVGPARDLGTIEVVNPAVGGDRIELFDSRGGRRTRIASRTINSTEAYEIMASNMSLENLAFTFGSKAVEDYSQPGTAQTAVSHRLYPDSICWLHDASGNYLYDISVVTTVGSLVANTDYIATADMLKMGYIQILPGATGISASGTNVNITFTPNAITASKRVFNPHNAGESKVEMKTFWTSDDFGTLHLRDHFTAMIAPATPEFRDGDFSRTRLAVSVLADLRNTSRPAGRFLKPKGALPRFTY